MLNAVTAAPIATASVHSTTAVTPGDATEKPYALADVSTEVVGQRDLAGIVDLFAHQQRRAPEAGMGLVRACAGVNPRRTPASSSSST